eukprot:TRINITY_DN3349_c0_g3_i2.p2 TRINITY_DN3349_c0_g3~~TRINITY_DN3349_c0_g3_i2.p2  ORF type:complete len:261 (-),score=14.19 TRINITY_DN3349_c0_g3_i2:778-1560(-)
MSQLQNQINEFDRILKTRMQTLNSIKQTIEDLNLQVITSQKDLSTIQSSNQKLIEDLQKINNYGQKCNGNEEFDKLVEIRKKLTYDEQQEYQKNFEKKKLIEAQQSLISKDSNILDEYYRQEKSQAQLKLQELHDLKKLLLQSKEQHQQTVITTGQTQEKLNNLKEQKLNQMQLIGQLQVDCIKSKTQIKDLNDGHQDNFEMQLIQEEKEAVFRTQQANKERILNLLQHNKTLQNEHSLLSKQLQAAQQHLSLLDSKSMF